MNEETAKGLSGIFIILFLYFLMVRFAGGESLLLVYVVGTCLVIGIMRVISGDKRTGGSIY